MDDELLLVTLGGAQATRSYGGRLREIRSRRPRAAVVLMTAYGPAEVVEDALALGASCVITKPFDMNAVEDLVQRAYRDARLR